MTEFEGLQDIINQAKSGDQDAIKRLLEELRPRIKYLASQFSSYEHSDSSTSDFVQEAWLKAWENLNQFRGGADDEETRLMLNSWIDQIVRRLGLNAVRDRQAKKRKPEGKKIFPLLDDTSSSTRSPGTPSLFSSSPTPSSIVRHDEHAQIVHQVIEELPDQEQRLIVRLRFIEGLSLKDISTQISLSYDQVRYKYQNAMEMIEKKLGDFDVG